MWVTCGLHPDCSVGQWIKWINRCDPLSTLVANTGLPKLPLDDLKFLRHQLAELHVIQVIAWNISVCSYI